MKYQEAVKKRDEHKVSIGQSIKDKTSNATFKITDIIILPKNYDHITNIGEWIIDNDSNASSYDEDGLDAFVYIEAPFKIIPIDDVSGKYELISE